MQMLDWPDRLGDRTPESERESTLRFSVGFRQTKREIKSEMGRIGADQWRMDDVSGPGGDPGVVVRWKVNGTEHAVACDKFTTKSSNAREVFLWIKETRMRSDRAVVTGADKFATARLPPGDEAGGGYDPTAAREPPHKILGVQPDAPEAVVNAAYRELSKTAHADQGGSTDEMKRLNWAKEQMIGGSGSATPP